MKKVLALVLSVMMILAVVPMTAYAAPGDKRIKDLGITLDVRLSGKSIEDFKDFFTLEGEGVRLDEESMKLVHLEKPFGLPADFEIFELEENYTLTFDVYAEDGYVFPYSSYQAEGGNVYYTVIREKSVGQASFSYSVDTASYDFEDDSAKKYTVIIDFLAEESVPEDGGDFWYKLEKFFESLSKFFTETFLQPIVDLIAEFLK